MMRQNAHAAGLALTLDRPNEAIAQYKLALERAQARDDASAIGDYGYDMAVAQLAANQSEKALVTVRTTRSELARRGASSFAALDLAEATARYRIGDKATSDRLAHQVEAGDDQEAALRASFLRGLIADDVGDTAELNRAIAQLSSGASPEQQADRDELLARRDIRKGAFASATELAEHAADLRRDALDYRGMARALAVAADAAARGRRAQLAANLYMRAGQSAAAQGDATTARPWLQHAMELSDDTTVHQAARSAIAALQSPR
ncbi:MAG TPA: hypothetical protein VL614_06085 [Acetobacteraceae bacterium]|nr:hypothetical protein [Acetobacteraceae bacterium]